jgi:hypothetical protein
MEKWFFLKGVIIRSDHVSEKDIYTILGTFCDYPLKKNWLAQFYGEFFFQVQFGLA